MPIIKKDLPASSESKKQQKMIQNEQTELIKHLVSQIEKLSEKLERRSSPKRERKPAGEQPQAP
jgi:hypothetical protein